MSLPTIGVENSFIKAKLRRVEVFDCSGDMAYARIRSAFYKRTNAVLFVLNASSHDLHDVLHTFMAEFSEQGPKDAVRVVVLNKADLLSDTEAAVLRQRVTQSTGLTDVFLVSAHSGLNVDTMFDAISDMCEKAHLSSATLPSSPSPSSSSSSSSSPSQHVTPSKYADHTITAQPSSMGSQIMMFKQKMLEQEAMRNESSTGSCLRSLGLCLICLPVAF